jgi:uncharacterized circularly permuted ATP-grasp superfamily protein
MTLFEKYIANPHYCELFGNKGTPLPHASRLVENITRLNASDLMARSHTTHEDLYTRGITFTLYFGEVSQDRVLPFDILPRVLSAQEWQHLEAGVKQRVAALNHLLHDVYHQQHILKDGIIPKEMVLGNTYFRKEMIGVDVPGKVYVHICGIDLVRDDTGRFLVLEDNARTPSGVSYVLENRNTTLRSFPDFVKNLDIRDVAEYGQRLRHALNSVSPQTQVEASVVLLSPGIYNSAYFEHVFLAQEMGIALVEGRDLTVENDRVYMRTTSGLKRVDVIYRRIDDDFLDPLTFRPDSMLGVPGIFEAYRKGNVTLVNAVGTGVADDKAVYAYMPRIIKYYLNEDPILPNVETHICAEADALRFTLENLSSLVVKPVGESGGYGLLIGPNASQQELEEFRAKLKANPANFISQPVIKLSVCPTLTEGSIEPRHVDLRPFAVTGADGTWVLPGGLTRVALKKGSLVVNSSQGGGSKDTWVME